MFGKKDEKPAQSGAEMMMRSLGMGPVLDMAIGLANDGTLAKIVTFADQADEILKTLRRIENALTVRDYEAASVRVAGDKFSETWTPGFIPCSGCRSCNYAGSNFCASCGLAYPVSKPGNSTGHVNGSGPANGGVAPVAVDGDGASVV